jgi:N6-L-threonylcarbamoyladenine synthase
MAGCLSVGSNAAKNIAAALNKPLVGVHHMVGCMIASELCPQAYLIYSQQAHALTPFLTSSPSEVPQFPFLTLLISGGHTLLLLANSLTSFRILATTADESIGRAFDKVSRMLDLKWTNLGPGAALERFCADGCGDSGVDISLPRPMPSQLAFSYSGLHSAVERFIFARGGIQQLDLRIKRSLAREFQTAAVAQLEEKVLLGLSWCAENNVRIQHLVVSGGVASNAFLRER